MSSAEYLVDNAERHITEDPGDMRIAEVSAAVAQVRATLDVAYAIRHLNEILLEKL